MEAEVNIQPLPGSSFVCKMQHLPTGQRHLKHKALPTMDASWLLPEPKYGAEATVINIANANTISREMPKEG